MENIREKIKLTLKVEHATMAKELATLYRNTQQNDASLKVILFSRKGTENTSILVNQFACYRISARGPQNHNN